MKTCLVLATLSCAVLAARSQTPDDQAAFEAARSLQHAGKQQAAFHTFLAIPGGEHAAVTLARPQAKEFLEMLRGRDNPSPSPRAELVEADLLLALGRKDEARQLYHKLAAGGPGERWVNRRADYYPVEPSPNESEADQSFGGFARAQLLQPYTLGPGSQRDNWLLRRLLALDLDDDASAEFARIWRVHRTNTQPHVVVSPHYDESGNAVTPQKHVVRPAGFDGHGLQFALDYAFFLKRRGETNAALDVLLEPLRLLDLDRNPNSTRFAEEIPHAATHEFPERPVTDYRRSFGYGGMGGSAGISRKEFLRLCFGEFKTHAREAALLAAVQKQIDAGTNRARRVLARLRSLAGQTDAALALELDYIARGGFNEASAEWRRGLVYEEFQKNAETVASLEKFLTLKAAKLDLAEADETQGTGYALSQVRLTSQFDATAEGIWQRIEALTRLQRLYSALGQTGKALDATLRGFELNDSSLASLEAVEQAAQRFKSAGQEQRFTDWAKQRLRDTKHWEVRPTLAWHLRDFPAVIEAVAGNGRSPNFYGLRHWKERFAKLGPDQHRALLKAIVAANPKDSITRLELLDLDAKLDGPDATAALELLLDTDANTAFPRGKGARNRTQFRTYLDLSYRLMRLYDKNGQLDRLHALALRIARGEKPFDKYDQNLYGALDTNDLEEHGNAALALAIQHADATKQQAELRDALKDTRWSGARAQLERRLNSDKGALPEQSDACPWFNVPTNFTLLASAENVLCLSRDEQFVYAGQPWGVSVYDFGGKPVARIALGEAVLALAAGQNELWAGTPKGLFRIARTNAQWNVAHQWLHDDMAAKDRQTRSSPREGDYAYDNGVFTLSLDGELLWIGLRRNVQMLNTRTRELRAFSPAELKIENSGDFDKIIPDGEYVWASGQKGVRRYDRASGTWEAPEKFGSRAPVHLIDIVDGQVFGDVYLNDTLRHRPAFIDRRTLKVTPILLEAGRGPDEQMINHGLQYFGKIDGRIVFGGDPIVSSFGQEHFALDAATGKLRRLGAVVEKFRERVRTIHRSRDGDPRLRGGHEANNLYDEFGQLFGLPTAPGWQFVVLPDGTRVFGEEANRVRYEYPHEDEPDTMRDGNDTEGGLFFVARDGGVRRISSTPDPTSLRGDLVFSVLFDDETKRDWLCTSVGLARLDRDGRVREQFTRADGLCANLVPSAAKAGGQFYFASGWGRSGGGLMAFDPRTSVFTSWHRTDGLDADKLERVELDGARLKVTYGIERFHSGDIDYLRAPPGWFDPASGAFTSGGEAQKLSGSDADRANRPKDKREPLPFLGGWVTEKSERDGVTYWCGTRGLVIARGPVEPAKFANLDVRLITDPAMDWLAEAKRVKVPNSIPLEQLKELLAHTNGFLRARALASAMKPVSQQQTGYAEVVGGAITDSVLRVRSTAAWLLSRSKEDAALAPLRIALADSDRSIRAVAALALAQKGERPALSHFEEILDQKGDYGNFPFGADSSVGVGVSKTGVYEALAPHADREVFRLFMKHPLETYYDESGAKVFKPLGAALRRQPDIAEELLSAYQDEPGGWGQVRFAEVVFRNAGAELLPPLHRALTNDDRVIRSNAARGCGAIGDPSSASHLLKALDLESGLSRASIVWALGELKAAEALPKLIDLYTDARNDEQRRAGAGFRYSQVAAVTSAQFESLRSVDAIASDWDELKAAALPKPRDPRRNEELLTTRHILEAVRKIGPAAAQNFYRALAGGKDFEERKEAAVALADCKPEERATNIVILRNLLGDSLAPVRARAMVSLLLLGDAGAQPLLREKLSDDDRTERGETLMQLDRLSAAQIEFVRKELEAIDTDPKAPPGFRDRAAQQLKRLKRE